VDRRGRVRGGRLMDLLTLMREVLHAAERQARAADDLKAAQVRLDAHPTGYAERDVKNALKRMTAACDETVAAARLWASAPRAHAKEATRGRAGHHPADARHAGKHPRPPPVGGPAAHAAARLPRRRALDVQPARD